jgi:hydrogenase maturation factor
MQLQIPISGGKLPNILLDRFLKELDFQDPSLLIRPGVGEDTAAVSLEGEDVLVLKSDPITFVTDSIGYYSIIINANDIACSGALPRWFLATLLFPPGTTPSAVLQVMHELKDVCSKTRITLCGGHTEITDAVTRPVITGMMVGTVSKSGLIDKRMMKPGHRVLLTKGVAVEGTAIIAKEFEDRLISLGMSESEIKKCQNFVSDISIMKEAKIASQYKGVSAMHDVTEGGIATAVGELSAAGKHIIRIETDKIPVFKQTKKICKLLDINPLGLIGSGSLLICCQENTCKDLVAQIKEAGIDVECIGQVMNEGEGVEAFENGLHVNWPSFETDEITRLFSYH